MEIQRKQSSKPTRQDSNDQIYENEQHVNINNSQSGISVDYNLCNHNFKTNRGLLIHLNTCRKNTNINPTMNEKIITTTDTILEPQIPETFRWKDRDGSSFTTHLNDV